MASIVAQVAQVAGVDALRIISMIAKSARNAKMHKRNCTQMAEHVKMIGKLLERLKTTELSQYPATREPLEQLEEALGRALALVESCRDRSYLYLLAMGWSFVYQFRQAQAEIDRYLKILPLISLLDGYRIQERLQAIEEDHRDYSLDEEEVEAQNVILKSEHTKEDADILEKSLSRRYPHLAFNEALQEENEKLHAELQRSQVNKDAKQVDVIQHLIEVTETVLNTHPEHSQATYIGSRHGSVKHASIEDDDFVLEGPGKYEWQTDLLDCCADPWLCLKTCFYPCGTFVSIANVASAGNISREQACSDLMTYSLLLGCCCYTCCIRRRLRRLFSIRGGSCDDFLSHLMCCCCALVQEWREIKLRGYEGSNGKMMNPPPSQEMRY